MILLWVVIGLGALVGTIGYIRHRRRKRAEHAGQSLLTATELGDIEEMQALLRRPIDVNARNAQGWTPLHVAAAGGNLTGIELLLRHGAEVNAQSYVGATPLDNAMTYGRVKTVIDLLRAHGANGHIDGDTIF